MAIGMMPKAANATMPAMINRASGALDCMRQVRCVVENQQFTTYFQGADILRATLHQQNIAGLQLDADSAPRCRR